METKENNIDDLIRKSLSEEEAKFYSELDEPSIWESFTSIFKGRNRWITYYSMLIVIGLTIFSVYALLQFLNVETIPEMIKWGAAMLASFISVGFLKIYYWMQMDKNVMMKEIKRLGLQLSLLLSRIEKNETQEKK